MSATKAYFLCGIGGSGMLPLAQILRARGFAVSGSDRARDQGQNPEKFAYLQRCGVALFPQDGSGVRDPAVTVVASAAVESSVPDIAAAERIGARRIVRAALLADLFNASSLPIGIAGTSGKSTVTGMTGWILHQCDRDPTVMNGAVMKNFVSPDVPFASALVGEGGAFVSEVDESDGSIARYTPAIAVLNNIAHDHKTMDELRELFGGFLAKARICVVNRDNQEAWALALRQPAEKRVGYSLADPTADLFADAILPAPDGIGFTVHAKSGESVALRLRVPGRHNVANALAALAAAHAAGLRLADAALALEGFTGVRRRLETVGSAQGVIVIDDFAHNPDKIAASLDTLHEFPGRLLILFQPHGFGPLKLMKEGFVSVFADRLTPEDMLVMPPPAYFGGTVDRSVTSDDIVAALQGRGIQAKSLETRDACGACLLDAVRSGDRIVVMGARDDTLSEFAQRLLSKVAEGGSAPAKG